MSQLVKMIREGFVALVEPGDVEAWRANGFVPEGEQPKPAPKRKGK